jgi:tRNA nucleotidyltransferase (CCA-adding enzyme)
LVAFCLSKFWYYHGNSQSTELWEKSKNYIFDYNTIMRVILTHEQADFDALASLLAANLLDENAVSILPRRMNRNVSAFLTIYGAEFPFIEARDLPSEPIEDICLVDTQGMTTLKGVKNETRIRVIDHHPRREDISPDWDLTVDLVGATVTLLTEALQEKNGHLNPIQATLLLLGIYEDTGSLTYSRTTPRDLNAAAFLLSQGASLNIAQDYLNRPLSLEQQHLYDALREKAETIKIHGHVVVVTIGNAEHMDEELSTVAHKLRDILDPDALFVLVTTKSGVQMIARSTSDHIDVGIIASFFGGGGHDRASAALIRERSVDSIRSELIQLLPEHVKPAVTVMQIMSYGLQVLSPETSVQEAADRMQRYGYEGYPVVADGKVVGLLTRRAVDRALSHKLNLTTASLMNAGSVIINPNDSIEHLQHVMTDSGWGQIPVVEPDTGRIIGIVTRTDLLKILTSDEERISRRNVSTRIEEALPASRLKLLNIVANLATEKRMPIYAVGGFVRDLLLDRPSLDFDIVVEGDAIELARSLAQLHGGRVTAHDQFGTAKWHLSQELFIKLSELDNLKNESERQKNLPLFLDLITARTEFYSHPTALPTIERGSIKLDLHRRDFTINTLAVRLDGRHFGELHDYWGGFSDIRHKLVRVLHSLSFVDDPTRMLRAVRFEQRFGFEIEQRTLELLLEAQNLLSKVSGDRLRHEIDHIIDEPGALSMMSRLQHLGLLSVIHPQLSWDKWHQERCGKIPWEDPGSHWYFSVFDSGSHQEWGTRKRMLWYGIWLMRLDPNIVEFVCGRINYPRSETAKVITASSLMREIDSLKNKKVSQIVARLDEIPLLAIFLNYLTCTDVVVGDILKNYLNQWRFVKPTFDGNELRRRGLPPGPLYRDIISQVRNAWLDGIIKTREAEELLLDKLLHNPSGDK